MGSKKSHRKDKKNQAKKAGTQKTSKHESRLISKKKETKLKQYQSSKTTTTTTTKTNSSNDNVTMKKSNDETTTTTTTTTTTSKTTPTPKIKKTPPIPPSSPPPSSLLNISLHRLRHLHHLPSPILRLTSPPPSSSSSSSSSSLPSPPPLLAISREGGSITLLSPHQSWRTIATIPGSPSKEADCLEWFETKHNEQQCCLVLIGGSRRSGTIFEIDFRRQGYKNVRGSGGGSVLSMACREYVAVGCDDGAVRIWDYLSPADGWVWKATLPTMGSGVLSVAWSRDGRELFCGLADSTIRRFKFGFGGGGMKVVGSGRMMVETLNKHTPTRVWCLKVLRDGTVISGDSTGKVHFWTGHDTAATTTTTNDDDKTKKQDKNYTLTASFNQSDNYADVFDIVTSHDENSVFASGVDSRIVKINRTTEDKKWFFNMVSRKHTHDVRSLAVVSTDVVSNGNNRDGDVLVSGGIDCKICLSSVNKFYDESERKVLYPWDHASPISMAKSARVLLLRRRHSLEFYGLADRKSAMELQQRYPFIRSVEEHDDARISREPVVLEDMGLEIKGGGSSSVLVTSDLEDKARLVAVSDGVSLMVFWNKRAGGGMEVEEEGVWSKLTLPEEAKVPCTVVKFSHPPQKEEEEEDESTTLFAATTNNHILILSINTKQNPPTVELRYTVTEYNNDNNNNEQSTTTTTTTLPINHLSLSPNNQYLALSTPTLTPTPTTTIHILSLSPSPPSHHLTLPNISQSDAPPTTFQFFDNTSLVVACSNKSFYIWDIKEKRMGEWSRDVGFPISVVLPKEGVRRAGLDCPRVLVYNPATPSKFLMGFHSYFCAIDLDQPIPSECDTFPPHHNNVKNHNKRNTKRRVRTLFNPHANFTICLRFQHVLFMDFIGDDEMVVVEQPWTAVVEALPEALHRKLYGA